MRKHSMKLAWNTNAAESVKRANCHRTAQCSCGSFWKIGSAKRVHELAIEHLEHQEYLVGL